MEINEQKKVVEKLRTELKEISEDQQLLNEKLKNEKRRLLIKQKKELDKKKIVLKNKKAVKEKEIHNQKLVLNEKKKALAEIKKETDTINEQKKINEKLRKESKKTWNLQQQLNENLENINTKLSKNPQIEKDVNSLLLEKRERRELLNNSKKELDKENELINNKKMVKEKEIYDQKEILKEKEKVLAELTDKIEKGEEQFLNEKNEQKMIIKKLRKEAKEIDEAKQQIIRKLMEIDVKLSKIPNNKNNPNSLEIIEKEILLTKRKKELDKEIVVLKNKKQIKNKEIRDQKLKNRRAMAISFMKKALKLEVKKNNKTQSILENITNLKLTDEEKKILKEIVLNLKNDVKENGLKKEEKLLKNKTRNKGRNQNQNQEYNKALIQKEFREYRKCKFINYISFSILKNKNENKNENENEIDNKNRNDNDNDNDSDNENNNDYKINEKEKVLKLEKQLHQFEEELEYLNETKVIYNKLLKSQLKSKFELKIKRKGLRDKLKQIQLERSELKEKLKETNPENKLKIEKQQEKLKNLQVELKEQIQQLISEKKQQRNERKEILEILNQFINQKEILRKVKITYTLYNHYINSVDKKLVQEVQEEDDEKKENEKKIEREEEEDKKEKIKPENKSKICVQTGRFYSIHAIVRMKQRNITMSMVENAIKRGNKKSSHGNWLYIDPISQVIVVMSKDSGIVITTMVKNSIITIDEKKFPILHKVLKKFQIKVNVVGEKEKIIYKTLKMKEKKKKSVKHKFYTNEDDIF
ncbi:hypothetical protein PIROE2DRAFT_63895 [Piromyces sp. E2]|nr:hypothetical protein PIROE2DRAFT_63895 [Piromyces sp. E2]|eukprot:OUM59256.1 hypothetical protein PIROE2DRAFT_63895 [Piromyces sp. E2]